MLLTKFHIIWPSGFRGKAVLEIEQELPMMAMFVNESKRN
jgi:hypothetical protein